MKVTTELRTENYVWDPLVRIAHMILVIAFFTAYFSEGDPLNVHVWAGYILGAAVLLRIIWGIVGPARARFKDFIYTPRTVLHYLGDLLSVLYQFINECRQDQCHCSRGITFIRWRF